jgi:hypothetical protein
MVATLSRQVSGFTYDGTSQDFYLSAPQEGMARADN